VRRFLDLKGLINKFLGVVALLDKFRTITSPVSVYQTLGCSSASLCYQLLTDNLRTLTNFARRQRVTTLL